MFAPFLFLNSIRIISVEKPSTWEHFYFSLKGLGSKSTSFYFLRHTIDYLVMLLLLTSFLFMKDSKMPFQNSRHISNVPWGHERHNTNGCIYDVFPFLPPSVPSLFPLLLSAFSSIDIKNLNTNYFFWQANQGYWQQTNENACQSLDIELHSLLVFSLLAPNKQVLSGYHIGG